MKGLALIVAIIFIWASGPPTAPSADSGRYLALGDSYTIGQSVEVQDRYPVQAVQLLRNDGHSTCKEAEIIATTGWTTGNLLDALAAANPPRTYNIVTLLIGVNNQFQGGSQSAYKEQFTNLLQQSIVLAGNKPSHVIVLSIPDYSVTPFAKGMNTALIASQIDSFNTINYQVSVNYKVNYVDVTAESRKAGYDPSLVAMDGLHFSGKEYRIWARLMEPLMRNILKASTPQ